MIVPTFHHTLLFAVCTSLLGGQIRDASGQGPEPFVIKRDPIKTFTFADGAQLQVFLIHENRIRIGRTTKPKDFKGHWSSNTYTVGSSANSLEETRFSLNGQIQGHHWEGQPSSLLLLCRILNPKKEAVVPKRFVWGHGSKGENVSPKKRDHQPTWQEMLQGPTNATDLPLLLTQIKDGNEEWINGDGPVCAEGGLGVIAFRVWPRSLPKLNLRVAMRGQKPVFWEIANPLHPVQKAKWEPDALPGQITEAEYVLKFQGLSPVKQRENVFHVDFEFQSLLSGDDQVGPNH